MKIVAAVVATFFIGLWAGFDLAVWIENKQEEIEKEEE